MTEGVESGGGEQTRFFLKMGGAELEFVGDATTLEKTIMPVANKMIALVDSHADLQRSSPPLQIEGYAAASDGVEEKLPRQEKLAKPFGHSTNTIAVAMKAETAPDLAMAACAHIGLVKAKATFGRKEILDEMKSATGFFNANMTGNLTKILANLTKAKRLHLVGSEVYALPNDEKAKLERILAEIG